tara:strand:- start:1048 stop:2103 length:1056 start_codon:yes stop_codon:yes gene_type:complete
LKLTLTRQIRRLNRIRLFVFFLLLVFLLTAVFVIENLLVSTLVAFVISYLLNPIVNHLERRGFSRMWSTFWTFTLVGGLIGLTAFLVFPIFSSAILGLQQEAPKYIEGLSQLIEELEKHLKGFSGPLLSLDLREYAVSSLTQGSEVFFNRLPGFLKQTFTVMMLGPFLAFFMVKDGRAILRQTFNLIPNHIFETALSLQHQINHQLGFFVRARLFEALLVGLVTWLGLVLIDFPFSLLLALFAAVTNLIPYIGPLIGMIPALVIALVNGSSSFDLFLVFGVYAIAQFIDGFVLIPFFVAKIVNLHPVTVIIVIIAGSQFMGILGMIISIPLTSAAKVTLEAVYRHLTESRI